MYQIRAALEIPELEELDDVDETDERIFVEMDEEILTLNKDMGVIVVTDEEGEEIKKADAAISGGVKLEDYYAHIMKDAKTKIE